MLEVARDLWKEAGDGENLKINLEKKEGEKAFEYSTTMDMDAISTSRAVCKYLFFFLLF